MNKSDALPTVGHLRGTCPYCNHAAYFEAEVTHTFTVPPRSTAGARATYAVGALRCQGCREVTVCISDVNRRRGIHWWPTPGAGTLDPEVDAGVASTYDEGVRCLNVGANRAAAVMFRSALHLYVKDRGDEKAKSERHLKNALKYMKESGRLHPSLADWADQLNQLGNEGAHPEDYDDVTANEASSLRDFVRQLITIEYEMPADLHRVKAESLPAEETS